MEKVLLVIISIMAGVSTATQAAVNGALGKKVGVIEGAFISFLVGTVALFLLTLIMGKGDVFAARSVPKWNLIGGILGAVYIFSMILVVPRIGISSWLLGLICGQIVTGLIIDHFGLVNGRHLPINYEKLIAVLLLAAALYLINKSN